MPLAVSVSLMRASMFEYCENTSTRALLSVSASVACGAVQQRESVARVGYNSSFFGYNSSFGSTCATFAKTGLDFNEVVEQLALLGAQQVTRVVRFRVVRNELLLSHLSQDSRRETTSRLGK